jgi:heme/copper-type cytochrome/quinol oxidase subunit 2
MCRASLESSGNQTQAEAVNDGIVYLMMIPYILVGVAGIFIYRMYRKKKTE